MQASRRYACILQVYGYMCPNKPIWLQGPENRIHSILVSTRAPRSPHLGKESASRGLISVDTWFAYLRWYFASPDRYRNFEKSAYVRFWKNCDLQMSAHCLDTPNYYFVKIIWNWPHRPPRTPWCPRLGVFGWGRLCILFHINSILKMCPCVYNCCFQMCTYADVSKLQYL